MEPGPLRNPRELDFKSWDTKLKKSVRKTQVLLVKAEQEKKKPRLTEENSTQREGGNLGF